MMQPSTTTRRELPIHRQANDGDLHAVVNLYNQLHSSEKVELEDSKVVSMWQQIMSDPRMFCFVSEFDNQVVSTCCLDIVPNLTRGARPFAVLQNVVTHENYRGLDIGGNLIREVLEFAWKNDCYQVLVQTGQTKAIGFYASVGFKTEKIGLVAKPTKTLDQF